ncbi:hypothetical protein INT45_010713 [Circinella minor]|uniref:Uncharacterized protein n=1 Tax=Circinella minor TaxID=1195481 RepID=A0A8H7RQ75_9FUNG|nr:hypothetical protein INT45_010713 [Circinella minor]
MANLTSPVQWTYYDTKSDATLKEAQQSLVDKFKISITQSVLQKHLVNKCGLTMKKLERISEYCGITGEGVVNLSLRRPQAVVGSKKRKLRSGEEKVVGKIVLNRHEIYNSAII